MAHRREFRLSFAAAFLLGLTNCDHKPLPTPTSAPSTAPSSAPSATSTTPSAQAFIANPPSVAPDFLADRPDEHTEPRRVLARIQGNLERVGAGLSAKAVPSGVKADEFEAFVSAYQAFLTGDAGTADKLAQVAKAAVKRLEAKVESAKRARGDGTDPLPKKHRIEDYLKLVSNAATAPVKNDTDLVARLAATMRLVDAVLLMESGGEVYDDAYDLFARHDEMLLRELDHFRDATWLRLPCKTILKHRKAIEAADKRLGAAAGPLLSCPVPAKHEHDYEAMHRWATQPGESAASFVPRPAPPEKKKEPAPEPVAPAPPWNLDTAIVFMADNPDAAEKPLAEAAGKNILGKLDYALFLQAFRPQSKERDAKIKELMDAVDKASAVAAKKLGDEFLIKDKTINRRDYDGTDESLVGSIRLASSSGSAATDSAFYAIPCAILMVRPKLLDATEPLFGGNRDNFLPRAGCGWRRGFIRGFPNAELVAWRNAAEEADGGFLANHSGTMRFALAAGSNQDAELLRTNPSFLLLDANKAPMAWPYETWSYMTPESRVIYQRLLSVAEPFKKKLVAHYKTRQFSDQDAERMAQAALFHGVWGADCGKTAPRRSLRKLIVDHAPPAEIRDFLAKRDDENEAHLEPFRECAKTTGIEPLIHIAVSYPEVLPVLWESFPQPVENAEELDIEVDPNTPNAFGKTPLMVAAQLDQASSAKQLLDHGAAIERTTYRRIVGNPGDPEQLAHDARTALMYAAARGSLEMIQLLLDRGADKYASDTKGRRALDYLLGLGPVAANSKCSASELVKAAKLLD